MILTYINSTLKTRFLEKSQNWTPLIINFTFTKNMIFTFSQSSLSHHPIPGRRKRNFRNLCSLNFETSIIYVVFMMKIIHFTDFIDAQSKSRLCFPNSTVFHRSIPTLYFYLGIDKLVILEFHEDRLKNRYPKKFWEYKMYNIWSLLFRYTGWPLYHRLVK